MSKLSRTDCVGEVGDVVGGEGDERKWGPDETVFQVPSKHQNPVSPWIAYSMKPQ